MCSEPWYENPSHNLVIIMWCVFVCGGGYKQPNIVIFKTMMIFDIFSMLSSSLSLCEIIIIIFCCCKWWQISCKPCHHLFVCWIVNQFVANKEWTFLKLNGQNDNNNQFFVKLELWWWCDEWIHLSLIFPYSIRLIISRA